MDRAARAGVTGPGRAPSMSSVSQRRCGRLPSTCPRSPAFRWSASSNLSPQKTNSTARHQEYNIAVKGDAGSGGNLLSTTIQCGMLLARLLTPLRRPPSPPRPDLRGPRTSTGARSSAFTDNIDVINRWLSDMIDAERNRQLAVLRLHPRTVSPASPPAALAAADRWTRRGRSGNLPRRLAPRPGPDRSGSAGAVAGPRR